MPRKLFPAMLLFFLAFVLAAPALAQDPEPGKDHPLVSRMPGFVMGSHKANFDAMSLPGPGEKLIKVEGRKTEIVYEIKEEQPHPSMLQILRNHGNALSAKGGKIVFQGQHPEFGGQVVTIQLQSGGRTAWVMAEAYADGAAYRLVIVEVGGMKQEVKGGSLRQALEKSGRVTLYINFDSGKASILHESAPVLEKVAAMLKADPGLKLLVEGHTDSDGQATANLKLSLARAASVCDWLMGRGVAAERLGAAGFGQAKPLADNASAQGKAKNRRVELVKL